MKTGFYIFVFWCWTLLHAGAQTPHIQTITVADGLSQGFVTTMCQDSRGFMWFGTLDGLNRYDGYSIRRYNYQPFRPYSLSGSAYITKILEGKEGLLWIGTDEFLYVFDPATERFFNVSQQVPILPRHGVLQLTMDSSGVIIAHMPSQTDSIGLYRLVVPKQLALQLRSGSDTPLAGMAAERLDLPFRVIPPIFLFDCIGDTLLLVADLKGQNFRLSKPDFRFIPVDLNQWKTPEETVLWGKDYGFFFRRKLPNGLFAPLQSNIFRRLVRLKDGTCLTTSGVDNMIYKFDLSRPLQSEEHIPSYGAGPERSDFIPFLQLPKKISLIMQDRSDVIWVGTGGYGLQKVNLRNLAFRHYVPGTSLYNFREMPDGHIWMGKFQPNKLMNLRSGQFEPAPWAAYFTRKYIQNLLTDPKGNIWFVTAGEITGALGSILVWQKESGQYRELASIPAFKEAIVEQILEDRQGNIWVAAHEGHLFRCRPENFSTAHFNYAVVFSDHNKNLTANAIMEDADGKSIWIGTSRGLIELQNPADTQSPAFRLLEYRVDNPQSLSWSWVLCLYQNPAAPNLIWIGTRGGGLNCYDKNTGLFQYFSTEEGLADNVVYGIVPDDEGNLWCSTNRGLSRFQPSTGVFVNYYESDGLQENEFNTGAFLRNREGLLLFGGVNGLTLFDPKEIKLNRQPPPVAITLVKVRGNPLLPAREGSPLRFAPYYDQQLTLPFSENNVTFEFAALDFANPATNRYRYKMQGIDREWIYAGTTHFANYASLPPGVYVFWVQAATADGGWSPQSARFRLVISPPWYRSRLAYLLYLLLGAGLVWAYIRLREERLREQHVLQLKNRESERLKELDTFKNRLFANITHEFRTPLTIILGLAERIRNSKSGQDAVPNATQIINQGNNLLDLVNQVLDLAKLESQGLTLLPVQSDLSAFVRFHADSFQSLAAYKNVKIVLETGQPDWVMDFDPQRFRQILTNLLSNAIRHTPRNGTVTIRLYKKDAQHAVMEVADTGEGIAPEDIPYIFDRFYQGRISEQKQGTGGIGLALTRELVHLAGGDIRVESEPGCGASFFVTLPVSNAAPLTLAERLISRPAPFRAAPEMTQKNTNLPLLLLIEDNPEVADYLKSCLHPYYRLIFAENGQAGIQTAFTEVPDIILSDIMMPLQDGLGVTHILKNDARTSHIPIVLLSAKTQPDDRLDGLRHGANAYLTKPFLEEELLLVLQNKLALQRVWKQRYADFEKGMPPETAAPPLQVEDEGFRMEDAFMKKLFRIFEENYPDEHFHLEHLCRLAGMSSSQLHRKLAALMDQSAMQLLRNFRLNKARELLLTRSDLQVTEVALMVGFNNAAHFSRMFSKAFGQPPSAFKK